MAIFRAGRMLIWFAVFGFLASGVLVLVSARAFLQEATPAGADEPTPAPIHPGAVRSGGSCLDCHGDPQLSMTFPNGETLSLYVDSEAFHQSVHGTRLACADCHQRNLTVPHEAPKVQSRRQLAVVEYESCKRCHFDNYTRTLDSMHFDAMAEGKEDAPICTDCHTAHNVIRITESRSKIAGTCSACHEDIADEYQASVHGSALAEEDNPDVPVCITCHGVHNIASAKTASFRQASVGLCAGCHADKQLMSKYDISADVFKTYLDDFHGKTVGFNQEETSNVWPDVAVCTDCHGVHDMKKVDDPESSVIKENLVTTCKKCHENATANFSSAWLSHYQPSMDKAPLVYLIKQYYRFLIPAMVFGLALNIALDLWRLARNR
jgi:predicted CXXCH cytochrome family protein